MPDVLDVIVIVQSIQQLAHLLQLIGVGQAGGGHGHHGQIVGEDLVALLLQSLDDSGVVLGVGGDLGASSLASKSSAPASSASIMASSASLSSREMIDDTLLGEHEGHAAHRAQVAAVLIEVVAQVGSGTVAVVGQGLDHDSHAAGAVALVGDGLVLGLVAALGAS